MVKVPRQTIAIHLALTLTFFAVYPSPVQPKSERDAGIRFDAARELISHFAGWSLSKKAIHFKELTSADSLQSNLIAEVELAFRVDGEENNPWRVAEVRTGNNHWEDVEQFSEAPDATGASAPCRPIETLNTRVAPSPDKREDAKHKARCAIARLFGDGSQFEAVAIRDVAQLDIPGASIPSSVVEARLLLEFAFDRLPAGKWRITGLRIKGGSWQRASVITDLLDSAKSARARSDLETLARGLRSFRAERGFYVVSDSEAILVDQLCPRYVKDVIRVDPWHHPYGYRGSESHFALRSAGPDGKFNTDDDVVVQDSGP